jgi:hypothetical protein
MTVTELLEKLSQLPRFQAGSSWVSLSASGEDSTLYVASANPDEILELELSFRTEEELVDLIEWAIAEPHTGKCRRCGCTDDDCSGCVERSGQPCWWIGPNICSACGKSSVKPPTYHPHPRLP